MPLRRLLVLTTGDPAPPVASERGPYARMIAEAIGPAAELEVTAIDARLPDALLPSPRDVEALVITGSSANVPDREAWVVQAESWLREIVAQGVPTFGICFGHQILAQALGGEVRQNPRGREIGSVVIERFGDDPIFEGVGPTFVANQTHVDTVARLPPGARALARSSLDDHQAIRFTSSCYGVQFHPEITGPIMVQYLEARRPMLEAEALDVDALKRSAVDAPAAVQTLRNFISRIASRG